MEVIKILLNDERVDPSAQDNEAIREACEIGYVQVVQLLLKDERVDADSIKENKFVFAVLLDEDNRVGAIRRILTETDENGERKVKANWNYNYLFRVA